MLEKDLYDKFTFKVLISRPQSVFTKAYVVIQEENKDRVLMSQYGHCFQFVEKGRIKEDSPHGWKVTDEGDIYLIDLKTIWEDHYQNISFPQFKYWYFNRNSTSPDKVEIMPSISNYIFARQKVTVEVKNEAAHGFTSWSDRRSWRLCRRAGPRGSRSAADRACRR